MSNPNYVYEAEYHRPSKLHLTFAITSLINRLKASSQTDYFGHAPKYRVIEILQDTNDVIKNCYDSRILYL